VRGPPPLARPPKRNRAARAGGLLNRQGSVSGFSRREGCFQDGKTDESISGAKGRDNPRVKNPLELPGLFLQRQFSWTKKEPVFPNKVPPCFFCRAQSFASVFGIKNDDGVFRENTHSTNCGEFEALVYNIDRVGLTESSSVRSSYSHGIKGERQGSAPLFTSHNRDAVDCLPFAVQAGI